MRPPTFPPPPSPLVETWYSSFPGSLLPRLTRGPGSTEGETGSRPLGSIPNDWLEVLLAAFVAC